MDIYEELGIRQQRSSPYHPHGNGVVEKANRVLVNMITMYAHDNPKSWWAPLPYVLFAYNTSLNASTKEVPFFVIFGRDPIEPSDLKPPTRYRLGDDVWDDFNWNWHRAIEASKEQLKKAQSYQKRYYDATTKLALFEVGDLVLYKNKNDGKLRDDLRQLEYFVEQINITCPGLVSDRTFAIKGIPDAFIAVKTKRL